MSTAKIKVWSWRHAIEKAKDLKPATKALLFVIGNDVSDCGKFSRRTHEKLAEATCMSQRSVTRCVNEAITAGFLKIERSRNANGHVVATRYYPQFPEQCELATDAAEDVEKPVLGACGKPKSHNEEMAEKSGKSLDANLALRGKPSHIQSSLYDKNASLPAKNDVLSIDTFSKTFPIEESASAREQRAGLDDTVLPKSLDVGMEMKNLAALLKKSAETRPAGASKAFTPAHSRLSPYTVRQNQSDGRHGSRKALSETAEQRSEERCEDLQARPLPPQRAGQATAEPGSRPARGSAMKGVAAPTRQNAAIKAAEADVRRDEVLFKERLWAIAFGESDDDPIGAFDLMRCEVAGHG